MSKRSRRTEREEGSSMAHFKYLIVGAGMTADAAREGIRSVDADGSIGMIGSEPDPPYNRPPLSKALWKGDAEDSIWRNKKRGDVEMILGRTVKAIDRKAKKIIDDRGAPYEYDALLLATGGTPRRLPFGGDAILYFRTLRDYRTLRALADRGGRFAVIGGGFVGTEIAAALATIGRDVTLVFPEETIGARLFPRDHGLFLNGYYREKGIEVLAGHTVLGCETEGPRPVLRVRDDSGERRIEADGVVAGVGLRPNVELAQAAGLRVGDGIDVDEHLRTNDPSIFAAGDVASFYNPALDRRMRVEHEDNANTMGAMAGRNMAGQSESYHHLPFFYSDLFDLGYEAVGDLDPGLEVVADWKEQHREGVLYYLRDGRVRGVLLWNVWGQVDAARELIAGKKTWRPAELPGRIKG
jgi:3-phenylpropionate/trans-cinnamate dioxygenase ferredoxin reductase subunit